MPLKRKLQNQTPAGSPGDGNEGDEASDKRDSVQSSVHHRKKTAFSTSVAPLQKKPMPMPLAKDIQIGKNWSVEPPQKVLQLLGEGGLVIGVDIETHDWKNTGGGPGGKGQFGFVSKELSQVFLVRGNIEFRGGVRNQGIQCVCVRRL